MVNIIYRDRQVAVEEEGRVKYYNTKKRSKAAGRMYISAEEIRSSRRGVHLCRRDQKQQEGCTSLQKRSKAAGRVYIPAETLGDISAMKTKRVSEMHICEGEVSTCSIIVALHVSCLRH